MVAKKSQNYRKPPGRSHSGSTFAGLREVTSDDVWTQPQRDLFREIQWAQAQVDEAERQQAAKVDFLALKFADLAKLMSKARISRVFKIGPYQVADLVERGETVRAIMEQEAAGDQA